MQVEMDLEFREPTEEERKYIEAKVMESAYDDEPVLNPRQYSNFRNADENTKVQVIAIFLSLVAIAIVIAVSLEKEIAMQILPVLAFGEIFCSGLIIPLFLSSTFNALE